MPGSGKSTVAQTLARRLKVLYLRVDTVEQAIRTSLPLVEGLDVGPSGYVTLYRLATDNLRRRRSPEPWGCAPEIILPIAVIEFKCVFDNRIRSTRESNIRFRQRFWTF
ncbi:AAA family ATPase [Agrobacterium sp. 22-226-1]